MRTWWRFAVGVIALLMAAMCAPAQSGSTELYTDTTLLITVRKLQLTSEQIAWVLRTAQTLSAERAKVAALRQSVWAEDGAHFDAVNAAWLKSERVPSRDKRAADNAIDKVNQARAKLRDAEQAATASLRGRLSDDQQALVESSAHAQARRDRQARMGGMESVGEFVASKLDETRDLMADEFRMVAGDEARAVAEAILGSGSSSLDQVAGNVLTMMKQVRSWDNARYARNREKLSQLVETFLRIQEPDWSRLVSYDELSALMTSERTVMVLGEILPGQAGTIGASSTDDELSVAQLRAAALNFFNSLGVTGEQATRMIQPLQNIQRELAVGEDARQAATGNDAAFRALTSARALLLTDREVPAETMATITQIEKALDLARLHKYTSVDLQMQSIAEIMFPAQNARLDWTPPASVRPERSAQLRAALRREIDVRIREAVRLLERIRFLDAALFVTGRIPIVNEYLNYNLDLGRPLPANAVEICLAVSDEARMVSPDDWNARAYDLGGTLVTRLGLMPKLDLGPKPGAIGWSALYRMFTATETLQVARELPRYR